MARREFQMPAVLRCNGPRPYWYIRYRQKVLVGKDQIERKEIWRRLGYCDEITKREAMRLREQVLHQVNNQVYTIQSQIPFEDFVKMYSEHHLVTLAPGGRKRDLSLLKNHILPAFTGRKLCEVGTQESPGVPQCQGRRRPLLLDAESDARHPRLPLYQGG